MAESCHSTVSKEQTSIEGDDEQLQMFQLWLGESQGS
jgi:hypothetical protein